MIRRFRPRRALRQVHVFVNGREIAGSVERTARRVECEVCGRRVPAKRATLVTVLHAIADGPGNAEGPNGEAWALYVAGYRCGDHARGCSMRTS